MFVARLYLCAALIMFKTQPLEHCSHLQALNAEAAIFKYKNSVYFSSITVGQSCGYYLIGF